MSRRELMLLLGGAMATARGLRAQQEAMPVIGYLGIASPVPLNTTTIRRLTAVTNFWP